MRKYDKEEYYCDDDICIFAKNKGFEPCTSGKGFKDGVSYSVISFSQFIDWSEEFYNLNATVSREHQELYFGVVERGDVDILNQSYATKHQAYKAVCQSIVDYYA